MVSALEVPFLLSFIFATYGVCVHHYYVRQLRKRRRQKVSAPISIVIVYYAVVGAFISALGNVPSLFVELGENDFWCQWEAYLTSLGDNIVIGWTGCLGIIAVLCVYNIATDYNPIIRLMKIWVWGSSVILATLPLFWDHYGPGEPETTLATDEEPTTVEYCWIKEDQVAWMYIQFYVILFATLLICLVSFCAVMWKMYDVGSQTVASSMSMLRKRRRVAYRLAFQLLYLFVLWGLDVIVFYAEDSLPLWFQNVAVAVEDSQGTVVTLLYVGQGKIRRFVGLHKLFFFIRREVRYIVTCVETKLGFRAFNDEDGDGDDGGEAAGTKRGSVADGTKAYMGSVGIGMSNIVGNPATCSSRSTANGMQDTINESSEESDGEPEVDVSDMYDDIGSLSRRTDSASGQPAKEAPSKDSISMTLQSLSDSISRSAQGVLMQLSGSEASTAGPRGENKKEDPQSAPPAV